MSKTISNLFGGSGRGWQKYTALNLLPITKYGTVEFRHMHGTNDFDKLCTWINSLSNLISVSYNTPLEKCIESIQKVEDAPYPLFNTLLPLFSYTDKNKELFNNSILYSKYLLASELKTVKRLPNKEDQVIMDELFDRNNDAFVRFDALPAPAGNRVQAGRRVLVQEGVVDWAVPEGLRPAPYEVNHQRDLQDILAQINAQHLARGVR